MKIKIIVIFIAALLVSGCAQKEPNVPSVKNLHDVKLDINKNGDISLEKTHQFEDGSQKKEIEKVSKTSTKVNNKGYEVVPNFDKKYSKDLALKNKKIFKDKKITVRGKKVKVSVESIPLNEFIDLMFANVLKLNYTVSEGVQKITAPITLNMTSLQPKQQVFDVVSKLLSLHGVGVKKEHGVLFLSKKSNHKMSQVLDNMYIGYGRTVDRNIPDDEEMIMFVTYNYIESYNVDKILKKAGLKIDIQGYSSKNLQLLRAKAGDIRKALKVINLIDRPYIEGKKAYIVELDNIEVSKFISRVTTILKANSIKVTSSPLDNAVLMSKIPELNSFLLISPHQSWTDMVLYWKNKLDKISEVSASPKFYVYKVKNRKADELAAALNKVIAIKLAIKKETVKKESHFDKVRRERAGLPKKIKKQSSAKRNYSVIADLPTNTLMMQLLPSEYREILPLIKKLDALPLEVLAEVTLAEVTLTDSFDLGFEYALRNSAAAGIKPLTSTLISAKFGGEGFSATYNSKSLDVAMNAYAENKLLNILSKPKILILNNETGSINVGSQIPIVTSESSATDISTGTDTNPSILRNITYRNTGVIVGLTPTINSNGILTMKVDLQLSEAQLNDTSSIDSPLIVNRTLSTTLTLKDGETVMLGGLISKNKSTTDSGVPYLEDIPWIGSLFKSKSDKTVKTELIMLIKPFIIKSPSQMNEKTLKYRAILKLLNKYSLL